MRHRIVLWTPLLLLLAVAAPQPAEAGLDGWLFGAGFRVGDVHFRVGYAQAGPYGPNYYFEAAGPLRYPAYSCSGYCQYRAGRHYHHADCPLVRHHFSRYGYAPDHLLVYYGPPPPRYYAPPPPYYYPHPYDRHYGKHWKHRGKHWKHRGIPPGHLRGHDCRYDHGYRRYDGHDHRYRGRYEDHRHRGRGRRGYDWDD